MKLSASQLKTLRRAPLAGRNKVAIAMSLANVTQMQVAAALGISQSAVSDVKRGDYGDLPTETSRAWAACFGCTIEDLFPAREAEAARA